MTIYFAGAIRAGRHDQAIYEEIIDRLRHYGTVLTEHVGDANLPLGGENAADCDIHDRDLNWLRSADVLVAEVTTPSLGVGYEIGRLVEWGKRIICLHRPSGDRKLSGMIAGCSALTVHAYAGVDELTPIFDRELKR